MKIISFYTSLHLIFYLLLSINTIRARRKTKIALGHNENLLMLRAMRAHSNFAEYVPFSLFAIFLVETHGANPLFVHFLGLSILTGRILHAYGISQEDENFKFRVTGMALTFNSLLSSAGYLLFAFLKHS